MQKSNFCHAAFFFLSTLLLMAHAEAVTAEEVIKKARAYICPNGTLESVRTLAFKAHVVDAEGKRYENIKLYVKKPSSFRIFRDLETQAMVTATNGYEGYKMVHTKLAKKDTVYILNYEGVRQLLARAVEALYFHEGHRNLKGGKVAYEGEETINGKPAHKLRFTYPKGADSYLRYFDVETGALLATITNGKVRQVETESMIVEDIRFAKKIEVFSLDDDKLIASLIFTEIKVNPKLSDSLFDFPTSFGKMEGWEKKELTKELTSESTSE